jgi:phosphatidylglycerol lysyltransferase
VNTDRDRVLELVQRHGWNSTAFQSLETEYAYYFDGPDACVAYVDTGKAWVAAGAPIAPHESIGAVAASFVNAAARAGRRCCFAATEDRMRESAGPALESLLIGEQPVWDPREWPAILESHRSLQEQIRRSRAKGVTVRLLRGDELAAPPVRATMTAITQRWLGTRSMAPLGFLARVEPFSFPAFRRCFVAELNGRMIAFAGVVPVPARSGWFIEDLVRDPDAPNGTGELLTDAVMRWAADEGCDWLTLGLAPLAGDVTGLLQAARTSTSLFYDFDGLRRYKAKLRPDSWSPIYVMYPPTQGAARTIIDMLVAFSRGGLLRFGLRTLLRGPSSVLRALAVLLVPWTALLALAPVARWFPSPQARWAWVALDVAVAAGLFRLLRHPGRALVTTLAVATTCDAVVTLLQAVRWNVPRSTGIADDLIIACACAAPAVASVALWGARRTRWRERAARQDHHR